PGPTKWPGTGQQSVACYRRAARQAPAGLAERYVHGPSTTDGRRPAGWPDRRGRRLSSRRRATPPGPSTETRRTPAALFPPERSDGRPERRSIEKENADREQGPSDR